MNMRLLIVLGLIGIFGSGTGSVSIAAETSGGHIEDPGGEPPEKPPPPEDRRLLSGLQGATPEEQARLEEERKRLSAAAAGFGTDPTAIIGYYQLEYGHFVFTNNVRLDSATATVRVPITPNFGFQVNVPYAWANLDQPGGFHKDGVSDLTFRTGGRVYASENVALFIGTDGSFPTASETQLGTGKYTIGPGGAMAVPLARVRSLFFLIAEDFNSIGGDPSRANLHFTQVTPAFNTIWSQHWWTQAIVQWNVDWNHARKTTMNRQGEIGHRFDNHWNVFATAGTGVVGRDTFLGLDWTAQLGVRWVFRTPLVPERLFKALPKGEVK